MDQKKQSKQISEILGLSLFIAMFLLLLSALVLQYVNIESADILLLVRLAMKIPIFILPVCFVYVLWRKLHIPRPVSLHRVSAGRNFLIGLSSVGVIGILQILYSAVFPSSVTVMGVSEQTSPIGFLMMFAVYVVTPAVLEEFYFRGVALSVLTVHRKLLALLISSLVFALMHFSIEIFPLAFLCGLVLGTAYLATGSLGCVILIHLSCNGIWYAAEITGVFFSAAYPIFIQSVFAACVLMLAAGVPMLKTTLGTVFEDNEDAAPSSYFWSFPMGMFIVTAALSQILWKGY